MPDKERALRETLRKGKVPRGAPGWRNPKRKEPTTGNELIRELFDLIHSQGLSIGTVSAGTLYNQNSFSQWASGESGMRLTSFVDIANFLGYDVKLVPKAKKESKE